MSQSLREFIRSRESDIHKQIESLEAELRDLKLARQAIDGGASSRHLNPPRASTPTIKEMILEVLNKHPDGGVADQIIEWVKVDYDADVPRSSMSPQLSRLKSEGLVYLNAKTNVWQSHRHFSRFKPLAMFSPVEDAPEGSEASNVMD
jgi:hypothetical protein